MHLDWWTIALQTVNFAILVWLLHRFLYKPVLQMIDARRLDVQRQYDEAKAAEGKAQAALAAIEVQRAGIGAERDAAIKAAAAQSQQAAEARHVQAERNAKAVLDDAQKTIAKEREHALAEAKLVALDLGAALAQRLLAEIPQPLRAEAWIKRIEQHLTELPGSELEALKQQCVQGAALSVVTVAPLAPEIAAGWRDRLHRLLGDGVPIVFAVDPALVAGVELHFPTAIVRLSWQSILAGMRAEAGGV